MHVGMPESDGEAGIHAEKCLRASKFRGHIGDIISCFLLLLECHPVRSRSVSPLRVTFSHPRFHGGNTGSNPVGDAKPFQSLTRISSDVRGTTAVQVPVAGNPLAQQSARSKRCYRFVDCPRLANVCYATPTIRACVGAPDLSLPQVATTE